MNDDQLKAAADKGRKILHIPTVLGAVVPTYNIPGVSTDLKFMGKPTLIIWGEKDAQIPLKFAQRLHRP